VHVGFTELDYISKKEKHYISEKSRKSICVLHDLKIESVEVVGRCVRGAADAGIWNRVTQVGKIKWHSPLLRFRVNSLGIGAIIHYLAPQQQTT
jgi:phosphomannomutase